MDTIDFTEEDKILIAKAERYCAGEERCCSEVRKKLYEWGGNGIRPRPIIAYLVSENFISEERYAAAFVQGKFHQKKWGRVKIAYQLHAKQIPEHIISEAMATIDDDEYRTVLKDLAKTKWRSLKGENEYDRRGKTANYLASKGFEITEIRNILKQFK